MTVDTRRKVRESYARGAAEYDARRTENPRGALLYANEARVFKDLLRQCGQVDRALEIGAGTGKFTVAALEMGLCLTVTDVNQEMLDQLRPRVDAAGFADRCEMKTADVFDLAYPDDHFDLVYSVHVIPRFITLDDQRAAIREIGRVLKPGGRCVFDFRNATSPPHVFHKGHAASLKQIKQMLDDAGLEFRKARGARVVMTRTFLEMMPMFMARSVAWIDQKIASMCNILAWDLFVLAEKRSE